MLKRCLTLIICLYSLKQPTNLNKARGGSLRAVYREKCLYISVLSVSEIILHKMITVINQYIKYN